MLRAARALGGALGIIEFPGIGAAHFRQNTIQGLHAGGTLALRQSRSRKTDGQSRYQKTRAQAHGRFLAFFK
jgi:hypothetical protein